MGSSRAEGLQQDQKPPDVPGAAQQVQLAGGGMGTQHRCLCIPQPSLPFRNDSLGVWGWLCADLQGQAINLSSGIAEGAVAQP